MKQAYLLRIPIDLYNIIKKEAGKKGISIHSIIINILWKHYSK